MHSHPRRKGQRVGGERVQEQCLIVAPRVELDLQQLQKNSKGSICGADAELEAAAGRRGDKLRGTLRLL